MQIKEKRSLTYRVRANDTFLSISNNLKVDILELKNLNKIEALETDDVILLPKSYHHCYVVKPLDTYQNIAKQLNITEEKVKELTKNKKIFVGQRIMF